MTLEEIDQMLEVMQATSVQRGHLGMAQQLKEVRNALAQLDDTERLDWLETHPRAVVYSQGYLNSKSGWTWRDENESGQDATDLREAIDAAKAAGFR